MKTTDIGRRISLVAFVPAALIGLTLALYLIVLRYHDADIVLAERGALLARQLASAAEYGIFSGNTAELRRLAESARHEADVTAVAFQNREGVVLASVGRSQMGQRAALLSDDWQSVSSDGTTLFFHSRVYRTTSDFDDPFAAAGASSSGASAAETSRASIGGVTVEISRAAVIASQRETLAVTTSIFLVALLIGTLLGRRLSRDVVEPIVTLQKTVMQIHDGNLDVRVPRHRGGALYILEDGINEMTAALSAQRGEMEARIAEATSELRHQKEEAERTNLAKSRFLAAASHDLRQPLHALALFVAELEHQPDSLPQRRLLKNIGNAVEALNHQFSALLDISRLDLAETAAHPEPFALSPLIARVIAVHTQAARAKGLRLRHVRNGLWTHSDPRLLERMLGNLLSNAIRYTQKGGIVIGVRRHGDDVRIEVVDSGIGIDDTQLPLIFQEFYQVGNPERDAEKGLGLGLSIVHRMAQILGHRLEVISRPGHGSTFRIVVPRAAPLYVAVLPPEPLAPDFPRLDFDIDVLVFCDVGDDRSRLCDLLQRWGCGIACADSSAEYDERISRKPGLVICDVSHAAVAKGFIDSFQTAPPILVVLGSLPEEIAGAVPSSHILVLPLRPARLRALLQQLLRATDSDENGRDEASCRVQETLRQGADGRC